MKRALLYGAVLIGAYLVVANATAAGRLIGSTGQAVVPVVKAFQGRG